MSDNQSRDFQKFYVKDPTGFSPERNKFIIEKTIQEYEQKRRDTYKKFHEDIRERAVAVADYLRHLDSGKATSVEKYFGKQELARLRGEDVLNQIKGNGKDIVSNIIKKR